GRRPSPGTLFSPRASPRGEPRASFAAGVSFEAPIPHASAWVGRATGTPSVDLRDRSFRNRTRREGSLRRFRFAPRSQRATKTLMLSFRPVRSSSSFSWLVAALLLASAVSNHRISAGEPSGDARPSWTSAWDAVRQDEIRAWVRFLAAPELRGRKSGDAGYDLAALWVSTQLEAIGIEPATDDGSYLQPFELLSDPHLAW